MTIEVISAEATMPIRHQVLWPDKPRDYVLLPEDKQGIHYGIKVENAWIAVVSCFDNGTEMQFRKLATLAPWQGRGFGTQLLRFVFQEAEKRGITAIWCHARLEKVSFYKKLGLAPSGGTFLRDDQPYIRMEWKK
jgi:GNAT superfamily N-acetyltransferase